MKKLSGFFLLLALLVNVGFVAERKIPLMPTVVKSKVTNCNKRDRLEKRVLKRKYRNGTLELKVRITGSEDDKLITVGRYTGDTLYLKMQHPPQMRIDTTNGKRDTTFVNVGCWCDFYVDVKVTIENLRSDPKYISIKRYFIIGNAMKEYDKNGTLGEVHNN